MLSSSLVRLLLVGTALLAGGCSSRGSEPLPSVEGSAVEAAIPSMERARTAAVGALDLLLKTADAIDTKDADGAAGDRTAMHRHARAHPLPADALRAVGTGLRSGAASYAEAVEVLSSAAARSRLPAAQSTALTGLITAARGEAAACSALAAIAEQVWPSYRTLAKLEATWLTRARAGWYRDRAEAADAYAVLTSSVRPAVTAARPRLVSAANERALAAQDYGAAVTAFRASVRSPAP